MLHVLSLYTSPANVRSCDGSEKGLFISGVNVSLEGRGTSRLDELYARRTICDVVNLMETPKEFSGLT